MTNQLADNHDNIMFSVLDSYVRSNRITTSAAVITTVFLLRNLLLPLTTLQAVDFPHVPSSRNYRLVGLLTPRLVSGPY